MSQPLFLAVFIVVFLMVRTIQYHAHSQPLLTLRLRVEGRHAHADSLIPSYISGRQRVPGLCFFINQSLVVNFVSVVEIHGVEVPGLYFSGVPISSFAKKSIIIGQLFCVRSCLAAIHAYVVDDSWRDGVEFPTHSLPQCYYRHRIL